MDESIEKAIGVLKQKVEQKAKELNDAKRAVNQLCICIGEPPIYNLDENVETWQLITDLKGHEYYMKPFATVVTNILERRGERGGPTTIKEIYEQMKAGGYLFETGNDANAMRGIRGSMGKNTQTFHKLPNGKFGLLKWFPELKEKKVEQGKSTKTPRRRGRPPKKLVQSEVKKEETTLPQTIGQTEQPKRRGRPPKTLIPKTITPPTETKEEELKK
jgi:hypothetical protein